jgi:hypothetical protein
MKATQSKWQREDPFPDDSGVGRKAIFESDDIPMRRKDVSLCLENGCRFFRDPFLIILLKLLKFKYLWQFTL